MSSPQIGTFIRPVGSYAYCLELVRIIPRDHEGEEQWQLRRYGLKDGKPFKDGHQSMSYLSGLKRVLPGVWKDEWEHDTPRWTCCPLYYRLMTDGRLQRDLFADL